MTDVEAAMLDLERQVFVHAGIKEQEIRDRFDCSASIYHQRLLQLIRRPDAEAHDPLTVRRLRRLRDRRAWARSSRRLA